MKIKTDELNWYVFGLALLTVGMSLITGHALWFVAGAVSLYLFGMSTMAAVTVRLIAEGVRQGDIEFPNKED